MEVSSDKPLYLTTENITSHFIHTDSPANGSFECSDTLINRLLRATNYSYLSNLVGYPTDCPHQRKMAGRVTPIWLLKRACIVLMQLPCMKNGWQTIGIICMTEAGCVVSFLPEAGGGDIADWTCSMTIIPWTLYEFYGDPTCLKDNYEQ